GNTTQELDSKNGRTSLVLPRYSIIPCFCHSRICILLIALGFSQSLAPSSWKRILSGNANDNLFMPPPH
ncbi:hypothetical protein, partial [Helicobacter cinaedi]|uniref:hypothetical protein n=1 Tax=Helicobacter cinaedi TaxID=213 RepID=UPI0014040187